MNIILKHFQILRTTTKSTWNRWILNIFKMRLKFFFTKIIRIFINEIIVRLNSLDYFVNFFFRFFFNNLFFLIIHFFLSSMTPSNLQSQPIQFITIIFINSILGIFFFLEFHKSKFISFIDLTFSNSLKDFFKCPRISSIGNISDINTENHYKLIN